MQHTQGFFRAGVTKPQLIPQIAEANCNTDPLYTTVNWGENLVVPDIDNAWSVIALVQQPASLPLLLLEYLEKDAYYILRVQFSLTNNTYRVVADYISRQQAHNYNHSVGEQYYKYDSARALLSFIQQVHLQTIPVHPKLWCQQICSHEMLPAIQLLIPNHQNIN